MGNDRADAVGHRWSTPGSDALLVRGPCFLQRQGAAVAGELLQLRQRLRGDKVQSHLDAAAQVADLTQRTRDRFAARRRLCARL